MPILSKKFKKKEKRSLIVHGKGLDELRCIGPARVMDVTPSEMKEAVLDPKACRLSCGSLDDSRGKDAEYNAQMLLDCFSGYPYLRRCSSFTYVWNSFIST